MHDLSVVYFPPGLQVAIKCKNSKGAYESAAVGQVNKSGAFSVPLAADAVGEDGELKSECFAQLIHSASSAPCPGQEPSRIVAAPPGHTAHTNGNGKTFLALGGRVYQPSPECASAFLCHPFFHSMHHHHVGVHTPVVIPHLPVHGHSVPPVTKPPPVDVPEHKPAPVPVPDHKPPSTPPVDAPEHKPAPVPEPEHKPPSTPANAAPSTPTEPSAPVNSPPKPAPIYHPPARHDAATGP
jgi:hypothetical protein